MSKNIIFVQDCNLDSVSQRLFYMKLKEFLLSPRLLSKNIKIGIYKIIILPVVLFGCETFFLIGIVGGGVQLGPLGTTATIGLLCQPRLIMMMTKLVE
jgi:hypothetical protein